MLSDKLLSKTDYNCDREIRTLELLKLRFGDANLHNCEVGIHPSYNPASGTATSVTDKKSHLTYTFAMVSQ